MSNFKIIALMCFMLLIQACGGSDKSSESKIITEETATASEVEVDNEDENEFNVGYIKKVVFYYSNEKNYEFLQLIIVKKNKNYYLLELEKLPEKCPMGTIEFKERGGKQQVYIKKNQNDFDHEAIAKVTIQTMFASHSFAETDAKLQEVLQMNLKIIEMNKYK